MIDRRNFIGKTVCAGVGSYLTVPGTELLRRVSRTVTEISRDGESFNESSGKPDVIFLMTDQHRWDANGINNPHIRTPNIDRFAREGILFNQAACQAPMCIPSRNSMMFGLYPSQLGIRSNGSHALGDPFLPCDPIPEMFRKAGYQTAGFGKTHWGRTDHPIGTRGFETRVVGAKEVGFESGAIHYQDDENPEGLMAYKKETAAYGGGEEGVEGYRGVSSTVADRDHRDGWVAEKCLEFLDSGIDPKRPLFLYLSFLKPHAGLNVPGRFAELYDIKDIPDTPQPPWEQEPDTHLAYCTGTNKSHRERYRAWREAWTTMTPDERRRTTLYYYANCSWLDDYFGQVMKKLEQEGRLKNAMIVFTSDHGDMLGERNYRFTKYCLYDSSVRVPLIISGPVVPDCLRGTIDNRAAELVDLYPTLARIAGADQFLISPGFDLLSDKKHKASFCEFHDSGSPAFMWRTTEWKLILFSDQPPAETRFSPGKMKGELYDLQKDPHEWYNLYSRKKYRKIKEKLSSDLLEHLILTFSGFPMGKG